MIWLLFVFMQELNKGVCWFVDQCLNNIKKVGILGVGFMGVGIVYVIVQVGINVVLIDCDQEVVNKGKVYIDELILKVIKCG